MLTQWCTILHHEEFVLKHILELCAIGYFFLKVVPHAQEPSSTWTCLLPSERCTHKRPSWHCWFPQFPSLSNPDSLPSALPWSSARFCGVESGWWCLHWRTQKRHGDHFPDNTGLIFFPSALAKVDCALSQRLHFPGHDLEGANQERTQCHAVYNSVRLKGIQTWHCPCCGRGFRTKASTAVGPAAELHNSCPSFCLTITCKGDDPVVETTMN